MICHVTKCEGRGLAAWLLDSYLVISTEDRGELHNSELHEFADGLDLHLRLCVLGMLLLLLVMVSRSISVVIFFLLAELFDQRG